MNPRDLATFVALPGTLTDDDGTTCVAWLEKADRVCGKPADWLCLRHEQVALRRMEKAYAKAAHQKKVREAFRRQQEPIWRADLAKVEARLDRLDPFRRDTALINLDPFRRDTAVINTPLSTRLPSEARIHELAQLHEKRASLRRSLGLDGQR